MKIFTFLSRTRPQKTMIEFFLEKVFMVLMWIKFASLLSSFYGKKYGAYPFSC